MTKKQPNYQEIAEQLAQENANLNEALLRERADVTNVRKRAEEDKQKLGGFYKALIIKEILPFIDNLDRAMSHAPLVTRDSQLETFSDWLKGLESINNQLGETLTKLGVERIKTVGEHFDPHLHEAVTMEEGDGKHEIVSEELQSGYKMGNEVIRHAMVRVKQQ